MRRLIPIVVLAVAAVLPATAQANHSDAPPHISCGEIDGTFSDFPAGPQTVVLHTTVDGVAQPDQPATANGPNFTTSTGYWNPDAGSHVVTASFSWTTSQGEGGQGPLQTTTVTNCPSPFPPITVLQQQSANNGAAPGTTNANGTSPSSSSGRAPTTSGGVAGEDLSQFVCTSRRKYTFLVRRTLDGQRVVGIERVLVRGAERYGSYRQVTVRGRKRFRVTADYKGLTVPRGQLRTITTFVKLSDGRTVRTVQFLRLCLDRDGNPNDTPSQDRANK